MEGKGNRNMEQGELTYCNALMSVVCDCQVHVRAVLFGCGACV